MAVAVAVPVVGWDAAGCGNRRRAGLTERGTEGYGDRRRDRDPPAPPIPV